MKYSKMCLTAILVILGPLILLTTIDARAEMLVIENFQGQPEKRWRFFSDRVMGGVSSGNVAYVSENGKVHAHITGNVSTRNNGGFIQIRLDLPQGAPNETSGVRLIVRGNGQRYFVHLRTSDTILPWQYYQAGFDSSAEWREVRLPLDDFKPSGSPLKTGPRADSIESIGIVAYGRDHQAEIDVGEVGFY
jgi:hypothetical protein